MSRFAAMRHVKGQTIYDYSTPSENQTIVRFTQSLGNNTFKVEISSGEEFIVSLPKKFRKNIWVVPGQYALTEPLPENNKVKGEIVKILTKKQVKYYDSLGIWPSEFRKGLIFENNHQSPDQSNSLYVEIEDRNRVKMQPSKKYYSSYENQLNDEEGYSEDSEDDESDLEPNPNRKEISRIVYCNDYDEDTEEYHDVDE